MKSKIGEVRLVSKKGKQIAKRVIYMTCRDKGTSLAITFTFRRKKNGNEIFNPYSLAKKFKKKFEWVTVKKTASYYKWNGGSLYTKFSIHFSSEIIGDISKKVKELDGMVIPVRQYIDKTDGIKYYDVEISISDFNLKDIYKGWIIDKL